jgi:uncharacterized protein YggE
MLSNAKKINLSFDPRAVIIVLLVIIVGMLLLWKPWDTATSTDRTVTVTGEASIKAEPDEYVFYPSYDFKNSDKAKALTAMTKKSDAVVAGLKKVGVPDSGIKTNSSGYETGYYLPVQDSTGTTYSLTLTVTVSDKELAQKAQDYLITTSPSGQISPQADFSDTKRKTLESQARDEAETDARAKADQSAKNLGFKISKVKSITDGSGFGGGPMPYGVSTMMGAEDSGTVSVSGSSDKLVSISSSALPVQPGENELSYSVTVVYYIK